MKYLAYLLLGLNVAYFAWIQSQPTPSPPTEKIRPPPPGVERLVLLSERNPTGLRPPAVATEPLKTEAAELTDAPPSEPEEPSPGEQAPPQVVKLTPVCRTLGPLPSAEEAAGLRGYLSSRGFSGTLREGEIQVPSGYQVYLPATSSAKASETVSGLKAAGVTDYFVGKQNRISLGIFSSKGKAQVRHEAIRKLGYDAMLNARYKTRKVYWIDIEENNRQPGSAPNWQEVLVAYPQIKVQRVSCE